MRAIASGEYVILPSVTELQRGEEATKVFLSQVTDTVISIQAAFVNRKSQNEKGV